jgi:hypothetical protein
LEAVARQMALMDADEDDSDESDEDSVEVSHLNYSTPSAVKIKINWFNFWLFSQEIRE